MLYRLEMGLVEQNLAQQARRAGAPIPDRIANAPFLFAGLELYLDAFFDLDTERQISQVPGRIPWSKVKEYAEFNDFDEEQFTRLLFFTRRLDSKFLEAQRKKLKQ